MPAAYVVDLGNTRMKWGRLDGGRVAEATALGRYPTPEWQEWFDAWQPNASAEWLIASVDPGRTDGLTRWLIDRKQVPVVLRSYQQIPLPLDVDTPESVGLDRLLACVGALDSRLEKPPFLVVQVGTALVVNFVDASGVFTGGAILPGFAMMAKALHEGTAKLPAVPLESLASLAPGRTTQDAIQLGILAAALGTVRTLREGVGPDPWPVFLTGGDAGVLRPHLTPPVRFVPDLVLGGLQATAEKLS